MYLATADIMQRLDQKTIKGTGIPGVVLMENAGRGIFQHLCSFSPDLKERTVAVIAGKGNNGGDGFVIARYLTNEKIKCRVFLLTSKEKVMGDALVNLNIIESMGIPLPEITSSSEWKSAFQEMRGGYNLIIDAIFGTGLNTEIRGLLREVIEDVNTITCPKVAVDIPSGLNASNGKIMGACIKADLTITMGLPKIGQVIFPGADYTGTLKLVDISLPQSLVDAERIPYHLILFEDISGLIIERGANTHKGNFGHLLVLAGSPGKTGAAALTCDAAMRVGTGLVTLGIARSLNPVMEVKLTEAMTEPLPEEEPGFLGIKSWEVIKDIVAGKTAVAIGPGISTRKGTSELVSRILEVTSIPAVVDADGITCLYGNLSVLKKVKAPVILTPHPGEMARLLQCSPKEIQDDRIGISRQFAQQYGVYVVLKGARTVIAEPDGTVSINPTGNPGMASGGAGDALTGMIGGLIAQGYPVNRALHIAVFAHGLIADIIALERGKVGITAGDIIHTIPRCLNLIAQGDPSRIEIPWGKYHLLSW
jgi:ADP-dependent NAD(P)H-hydrate dehydratase / NAD(P)H-hydrate epimerase